MATAKTTTVNERPLIQIDDEIREMTEEEYQQYLYDIETTPKLPESVE